MDDDEIPLVRGITAAKVPDYGTGDGAALQMVLHSLQRAQIDEAKRQDAIKAMSDHNTTMHQKTQSIVKDLRHSDLEIGRRLDDHERQIKAMQPIVKEVRDVKTWARAGFGIVALIGTAYAYFSGVAGDLVEFVRGRSG